MTRPAVPIALIAAVTLLLTLPRLAEAPPYLTQDEAFFGLQAQSIATTGRDLNGHVLPLYFQWPPEISTNIWFQPVLIYFTTLFVTILPLSEAVVRLPTVIIGLANVILMYLIARRLFRGTWLPIVAAGFLLLTPAHFIHSRLAMDYLYPVPFLLAWLLCLIKFSEREDPRLLFCGTFALAVGFYSYIAAIVMMPIYLALTALLLLMSRKPLRLFFVAGTGFAIPLIAAAFFLLRHPEALAQTAGRYELAAGDGSASAIAAVVGALRSLLHFYPITERVSLYWSFFDPAYLFMTGGVNVVNSTRFFGVFLAPLAVFLVVGINQLLNARRTPIGILLLLGFVTAPLAACLVLERYAIDRELELLPFAVLIAVFGLEAMARAPQRVVRIAAIVLLLLMPVQFAFFYGDYFGDYGVRSAGWFGGNVAAGFDRLLASKLRQANGRVYLTNRVPYVAWFWRFYTTEQRRPELFDLTVYFDSERLDVEAVPAGSVLLLRSDDPARERWVGAGAVTEIPLTADVASTHMWAILEKR